MILPVIMLNTKYLVHDTTGDNANTQYLVHDTTGDNAQYSVFGT